MGAFLQDEGKSGLLSCGMVLNVLYISCHDPRHRYGLTPSPFGSDILLGSQTKAGRCWTPLPVAEPVFRELCLFPHEIKHSWGTGCLLTAPAPLLKLQLACHQYCLNKHIRRRSSRPSRGAGGKEPPQPGSRPSCGRSGRRARGRPWHRVPAAAVPEGFPPHLWPL